MEFRPSHVTKHTCRDSVCYNNGDNCQSTLTRFVWAGDQLLWELRVPGGNNVVGAGLDATSAGTSSFYGRVSYFHAGGIDRPLLITKEGAESVVPRETWRGQFHRGTVADHGRRAGLRAGRADGVPDDRLAGGEDDGQARNCISHKACVKRSCINGVNGS